MEIVGVAATFDEGRAKQDAKYYMNLLKVHCNDLNKDYRITNSTRVITITYEYGGQRATQHEFQYNVGTVKKLYALLKQFDCNMAALHAELLVHPLEPFLVNEYRLFQTPEPDHRVADKFTRVTDESGRVLFM